VSGASGLRQSAGYWGGSVTVAWLASTSERAASQQPIDNAGQVLEAKPGGPVAVSRDFTVGTDLPDAVSNKQQSLLPAIADAASMVKPLPVNTIVQGFSPPIIDRRSRHRWPT
jgi:hypothetical protein